MKRLRILNGYYIPLTSECLSRKGFYSAFTSDPQHRPASIVFRLGTLLIHQPNEEQESFILDDGKYYPVLKKLRHLLQTKQYKNELAP